MKHDNLHQYWDMNVPKIYVKINNQQNSFKNLVYPQIYLLIALYN